MQSNGIHNSRTSRWNTYAQMVQPPAPPPPSISVASTISEAQILGQLSSAVSDAFAQGDSAVYYQAILSYDRALRSSGQAPLNIPLRALQDFRELCVRTDLNATQRTAMLDVLAGSMATRSRINQWFRTFDPHFEFAQGEDSTFLGYALQFGTLAEVRQLVENYGADATKAVRRTWFPLQRYLYTSAIEAASHNRQQNLDFVRYVVERIGEPSEADQLSSIALCNQKRPRGYLKVRVFNSSEEKFHYDCMTVVLGAAGRKHYSVLQQAVLVHKNAAIVDFLLNHGWSMQQAPSRWFGLSEGAPLITTLIDELENNSGAYPADKMVEVLVAIAQHSPLAKVSIDAFVARNLPSNYTQLAETPDNESLVKKLGNRARLAFLYSQQVEAPTP